MTYKTIINGWIKQGMIDPFNDNWKTLYNIRNNTKKCRICDYDFSTYENLSRKCVEHNHKTGCIRGIVCSRCNTKIAFYERPCKNNTGIRSLYYQYFKTNDEYLFVYQKQRPKIYKKFKNENDAVAFSIIQDLIMKITEEKNILIEDFIKIKCIKMDLFT